MAKTRAVRPITSEKILGKNVLTFLNYGEGATPENLVWSLIGGQRNASLSNSADEIDLSDKNSGGYGETGQGTKTTELSLELLCKAGDETIGALRDAYDTGEAVEILRYAKNGTSIRNWYNITEFSDDVPHDDAMTLTLTLKGIGAPTYIENMANPLLEG